MNETENNALRVGDTLVTRSSLIYTDPAILERHYRSGIRVVGRTETGVVVRRIHSSYLVPVNPIESWTMRWDQLLNSQWVPIPNNAQIPLL